MLEMPADKTPATIALVKNEPINSKAIPVTAIRSSKLRAMVANIGKSEETEEADTDMESPTDIEDDVLDSQASIAKLQDMLIVPEIIDDDEIRNIEDKENDSKLNKLDKVNKELNQFNDDEWKRSDDEWYDANKSPQISHVERDNCNTASTSYPKDLSLSCINSSGISEANYRLGSIQIHHRPLLI